MYYKLQERGVVQWDEKSRGRDSLYFNRVVRVGLISKIMFKTTPAGGEEIQGRSMEEEHWQKGG